MPPRVAAVLPVVNDFHHVSAPRWRACTTTSEMSDVPCTSKRKTYAPPSPSCRRSPLKKDTYEHQEVNQTGRRTVRAKEEDFGLVVQIHETLFDTGALSRDQQIQNGLSRQSARQFLTEDIDYALTSTYFSKHSLGLAPSLHDVDIVIYARRGWIETHEGRMQPFAPPSGMSLFLSDWVDARP
jgi:hypothetical protein